MRRLAPLASLALLSGCVSMEWRGSMIPHLEIERDNAWETKPVAFNRVALRPTKPGWTQFRGPARDGVAPPQGVEPDWSGAPLVRWRVPAGQGHSSVILSDQSVFTMEQDGEEELVTARSLDDGEILWKHGVRTRWGDFMSGVGPRSTPTLHEGRLYALFSNGSLVCLNAASGKLLWKTRVIQDGHEFPEWGLSCSPLVWKDLVIVTPGGEKGAARAYHSGSGKRAWVSEFNGEGVYLSPCILNLLGREQLVTAVSGRIAFLEPRSGKTDWEGPWKIFLNDVQIAQPLALSGNAFLLSAGYGKGSEGLFVSAGEEEPYQVRTAWRSKDLKCKFSSPVLKDGFVYGFNENSLTCLDASDGKLKWRGRKYGYGRVLLAGDKLVILGNTGILSVVEANPEKFEERYSGQLLSDDRCWNGPALAGGYLVARNGLEIACFDWAQKQ